VRADDFLIGPRGRAVCAAYLGVMGGWQPDPEFARSPFESLADATTRAMYWQDPEDYDLAQLPAETATAVRRAADELAAHPGTAWWDAPIALDDQHVVDFESSRPQLTGLRARVDALAGDHDRVRVEPAIDWRTVSGIWWSAPIARRGVRTTRSIGSDEQPVGLACVEDELGWQQAESWPIDVVGTPRVFELAEPTDWVRLCADYPLDVSAAKRGDWWRATGRDGSWTMPDWPAVARDWDAVHLPVCGYLTTAGRALDVDGTSASVLAGWDPDATFWLNDVLRFGGDGRRWQRDQDGDWQQDS
jgi:hypothetical protein